MIFVTWFGAAAYCNWKSSVAGLDAVYDPVGGWTSEAANNGYRLPTEAEWYKAAAWNAADGGFYRYGTASDLISTNDANFVNSGDTYENAAVRTTPAGSYSSASPYGLYDASGNVSEWCDDLYSGNDRNVDPRVIRGGGWGHPAANGVTSARFSRKPAQALSGVGFRTVRTVTWE
jgi:formylglycine-generating enzyme required for sulfatase activity